MESKMIMFGQWFADTMRNDPMPVNFVEYYNACKEMYFSMIEEI
jgi:hypothetical protein